MPASLELKQQYGDDLHLLFVESQGADRETYEAFALSRKWLGKGAMWTSERPVSVAGRSLPKFALLAADGRLLLSGNPLAMKKDIEEALEREVDAVREGPEGAPREVSKAYRAFAKGDHADALGALRQLAREDEELRAQATSALEHLTGRVQGRVKRLSWLVENARLLQADAELEALRKGLEGEEELLADLRPLAERLADPALEDERAAEKALASIEKKLFDKPSDRLVRSLESLAEKHAGTQAAGRARRWIALLETRTR